MTEQIETPVETPETVVDDLDQFSSEFFGKAIPEEVKEEPQEPEAEGIDPPVEDANEPEAEDSEEQVEGEEDTSKFKTGKKKQTAKERIQELANKNREKDNQLAQALRELEELKKPKSEAPVQAAPANPSPDPDATNEDGTPKYPLGEFDPLYIRDLTRFTIAQETAAAKAEAAKEAQRTAQEAEQNELMNDWNGKLAEYEKEAPDIRTKGVVLDEAFGDLNPDYGVYLATTIMALDNGPAVLNYLADNLDEARQIANSGVTKATLALGAIDARLTPTRKEVKKVSNAPEPAPVNRGSSGRFETADDTDDLDAFAEKFFKKK